MPIDFNETADVRVTRFRKVWSELAPTETFGGMTLEQFRTVTEPTLRTREDILALDAQRAATSKLRDEADHAARNAMELVVNAVRGNPAFGSDSALYRALGFTPKSERRSGLTRKVKPAATAS